MGRDRKDVVAALAARVQEAVAQARTAIDDSQVLLAASRLVRNPGVMARRCAWCGRVDLGFGWHGADQAPHFVLTTVERRATHTICPDCVRRLEEAGQSHTADEVSAHCKEAGDPEPEDDDREP